jgi:4-oxalocrotonate tautomerase
MLACVRAVGQWSEEKTSMPLIQIKVVEGVLTTGEKSEMIGKVTDAVLSVYGENLRPHTWGLGGTGLTTAAVQELRGAVPAK